MDDMKKIVVYTSKTGFAQKYAEWIAEELGCEAVSCKKYAKSAKDEDLVIYGGGIMASKINGFSSFKKLCAGKKVVLFCTGATAMDCADVIETFKTTNLSEEEQETIPFFYFTGGLNYERMGFFGKKIIHMLTNSLSKKTDRTEDEENMLAVMSNSCDLTDKAYIKPLIDYVKSI